MAAPLVAGQQSITALMKPKPERKWSQCESLNVAGLAGTVFGATCSLARREQPLPERTERQTGLLNSSTTLELYTPRVEQRVMTTTRNGQFSV